MKKRLICLLLAAITVFSTAAPALAAARRAVLTLGDAAPGNWFYDAARWAVSAGVVDAGVRLGRTVTAEEWAAMLGKAVPGAETPGLDGTLDRASAVVSLYAAAAPDTGTSSRAFADASPDETYYEALQWASAAGIVCGTAENSFSPTQPVTVEQAVTMLYRCFPAAAEASVRETRRVPVFRAEATEETIELVFYSYLPNVAYVSVNDYFRLFFPELSIRVEKTGVSSYRLTSPTGVAWIDTEAETLASADLAAFTDLMPLVQSGMDNVYLDGAPYVRFGRSVSVPGSAYVTLEFAPYGIDLRGDGANVYFPIATLSDLYADLAYHFAFFSGEKVYVENETRLPGPAVRDGGDYQNALLKNLARRAEAPDLVKFNYDELCFAIDHFYGNARSSAPLYPFLKYAGLDEALLSYRRDGKRVGARVRELLNSASGAEYLYGMECLNGLLYDGGHTAIQPVLSLAYAGSARELMRAYAACTGEAKNAAVSELIDDANRGRMDYIANLRAIQRARAGSYRDGGTYYTHGDTAVCVFDTFLPADLDAMRGYMAQSPDARALPDGAGDPIAVFLDALYRAEADPAIKNLVIDVSANGGGSLDVVMAMVSLMLGPDESEAVWADTLTGQRVRTRYEIDRNFDGAFDERDREADFSDLHFAVITSGCSFSCGNLFPSLLKDYGVPVLGAQSGGGACAVQKMATADGFLYSISSGRATLLDRDGRSIDGGVPADAELFIRDADGGVKTVDIEVTDPLTGEADVYTVPDYAAFCDLARIAAAVRAFYAPEADLAA